MVTELLPLKLAFTRLSDEDPDIIEAPDADDIEDGDDDKEDDDFAVGNGASEDDDSSAATPVE